MNYPLPPRSPLTTQLSGSAKEIELRIRNIFQGRKKRPPVWLLGILFAVCLLCGSLVSCRERSTPAVVMAVQYFAAHLLYDGDTGTISNAYGSAMGTLDEVTGRVLENQSGSQQRDELILAYYQHTYPAQPIYWLTQEPAQPQEGDWRLDSVTYAGEALLYETTGVAFWVQQSLYSSSQWAPFQPSLIVLSQGQDGSFQTVLGQSNTSLFLEGMTIEDIIRQTAWHLLDVEVCLYRDGYPNPIGPGNWYDLFRVAYEGEPNIQLLEDYWGLYSGQDYLWYCNNPIGYGAAILFFFQGDTLTQITLQDMFD